MQKKLILILKDVYGGDGIIRLIDAEQIKLSRKKTSTKTRDDIGVSVESNMNEVNTEKIKREISTFTMENGKPMLRLGGAHGKLWGTFKSIRTNLYVLGDANFRSARLMDMIQVQPVWTPLESLTPMEVRQLPQILNSMGKNSMIIQYFDVIPRAKCDVTLVYPDGINKQVDTLIEQLKYVSFLNKRRTTIEAIEIIPNN